MFVVAVCFCLAFADRCYFFVLWCALLITRCLSFWCSFGCCYLLHVVRWLPCVVPYALFTVCCVCCSLCVVLLFVGCCLFVGVCLALLCVV